MNRVMRGEAVAQLCREYGILSSRLHKCILWEFPVACSHSLFTCFFFIST